jgi:hypothetical protein
MLAEKFIALGLDYVYELSVNLGTSYRDFTLANADTERLVYWEHLGLMSDPDYRRRWQQKLALCCAHEILPFDEGGGALGTRIVPEENEAPASTWH